MLVLFIALLLLVLVIAAFSGNDERRRDSYRRRRRYDDYDPYHPYYPPQSYPPFIEPGWGGSSWGHGGGGGDKSAYGFVAIVALGLLGYYVFANNGPGLNKDGPTRETYRSGVNTSDVSSLSAGSSQKRVFPAEHTLKSASGLLPSQPEVYTVDMPGEPADELNNKYDYAEDEAPLLGNYYIQTGSFSQLLGAEQEQDRLLELLDKSVRIHVDQSSGFTEFKLLVGPFLTNSAAQQYKKSNLTKDCFVKEFEDYTPRFVD